MPATKLRQPLKIHGGKHYLADWIISHFPDRDGDRPWHLYREPYAGGLSVLLRLDPEGLSEAVNDIDYELTNFWKVIADKNAFARFLQIVMSTPLCEKMWKQSANRIILDGPADVNAAVKFFIHARQSRQGLRKDFATPTRRIRRGMNENVSSWLSAVDGLPDVHDRLLRVEIREMNGTDFIRKYDDPEAVFYVDPTYMISTRFGKGGGYRNEMSDDDHLALLETLDSMKGRFLLSGYQSELYSDFCTRNRWTLHKKRIDNKASSKKSKEVKTECLWTNF